MLPNLSGLSARRSAPIGVYIPPPTARDLEPYPDRLANRLRAYSVFRDTIDDPSGESAWFILRSLMRTRWIEEGQYQPEQLQVDSAEYTALFNAIPNTVEGQAWKDFLQQTVYMIGQSWRDFDIYFLGDGLRPSSPVYDMQMPLTGYEPDPRKPGYMRRAEPPMPPGGYPTDKESESDEPPPENSQGNAEDSQYSSSSGGY
jgi:hypothetical protein